jgi:hypothetical protein
MAAKPNAIAAQARIIMGHDGLPESARCKHRPLETRLPKYL